MPCSGQIPISQNYVFLKCGFFVTNIYATHKPPPPFQPEEPLSVRWWRLRLERGRNCTSVDDDKQKERKPANGHARFFQPKGWEMMIESCCFSRFVTLFADSTPAKRDATGPDLCSCLRESANRVQHRKVARMCHGPK